MAAPPEQRRRLDDHQEEQQRERRVAVDRADEREGAEDEVDDDYQRVGEARPAGDP